MNRRNNMKRIAIPLLLSLSLLLSGCQNTDTGSNGGDSASTGAESVAVIDTAALFSDRDLDGSYDESAAVHIQLEGETAVCDSDAVSIDGSRITLLDEGTYLVSGALTDGQIVVDAGDTDKVQIVLASASLTCADSAAIYSKSADKVFLTLAEGTENTLTNGGSYTAIDKNNIDSVVFSKTDLTLNGSGSLTIDAQAGHGVVSKDELTITGGSYTVTAAEHGMVRTAWPWRAAISPSSPARTDSTPKTQMTPLWAFCMWRMGPSPSPPRGMPSAPAERCRWTAGPLT